MDLSFKVNLNTEPVVSFFSNNFENFKGHLVAGAKIISGKVDRVSDFLFGSAASSFCTVSAMGALGIAAYHPPKLATWISSIALSATITHFKRSEVDIEGAEEEAFSRLIEKHQDVTNLEELLTSQSKEFESIRSELIAAKEKQVSPLYDIAQVQILAGLFFSLIQR